MQHLFWQDKLLEQLLIFLFGLLSAGMIALVTWLVKRGKHDRVEEDALCNGVKALLHYGIYSQSQSLLERGWATMEEKEELKYVYRPYKALGGNSTAEASYHLVQKLPLHPPKGEYHANQLESSSQK